MNASVPLSPPGASASEGENVAAGNRDALDRLSLTLSAALPQGGHVALRWRDRQLGSGATQTPACPRMITARAARMLRTGTCAADTLDLNWIDTDGSRFAIAVGGVTASEDLHAIWQGLARGTCEAALGQARAQARIESLETSERLQQALYEIADLAGSGLELQEMLGRIHGVVGRLMYAENCYIVRYDAPRASLRFLYFADQRDTYVADPDLELPVGDMGNSLTVALLRHGQALLGPSSRIRHALGVQRDETHGPDSKAWLGVPMRRQTADGEQVCGAIVVQSYDSPASYSEEDRALLSYVAQHILTAIDRRDARAELEHRVEDRTAELQQANVELQAEIVERERAEQLQRTLFRIAELSISSSTLEGFYAAVHLEVGELLYAHNFYIALLDESGADLEFPYSIDERDAVRAPRPLGLGLTEYVLRTREPLLADRPRIAQVESAGDVRSHGTLAQSWLGVPLWRDEAVVGVIAVQSYSPDITFDSRDQELLTFVAHHIGSGLARKQAQERLLAAHGELEQRVSGRTRELASANRALTAQVAERLRAEDRLRHQAMHDALTGLPNRPHLLERLQQAITQVQDRPGRTFAVLFLDLDRFKLVNDSAGHAAGDDLLVQVSSRLNATLRQ
ncbi:MAG TPA: GAF domain-containing protein, partial [Xanthomonadaceae bacterium]|nr:GAF domain-containing protein [Xanthomonadaceae bacterium]